MLEKNPKSINLQININSINPDQIDSLVRLINYHINDTKPSILNQTEIQNESLHFHINITRTNV